MRVAGKLAAMCGNDCEHVNGRYHRSTEPICPTHRRRAAAIPAPSTTRAIQVDCTSINHASATASLRQAAEKRRHPEIDVTVLKDGYHGEPPHVPCRRSPVWADAVANHPGMHVQCDRNRQPGCRLGDIGEVIQKHAEKNGFSWFASSVARQRQVSTKSPILHYGRAVTGMD